MSLTSIIPGMLLVLLASNAHARSVLYTDDDSALLPIMSQSRRTRICYELCISGLGGTPCGDTCYDLIPTNFPVKTEEHNGQQASSSISRASSSKTYNTTAREDSCDVLCKNKLGYPLCSCNYDDKKVYTTDFVAVCSTFCVNYNYQLYGCQNCSVYKQYVKPKSDSNSDFHTASLSLQTTLEVEWPAWCRTVCSNGNGGAACQCDLLP